MNRSAVSCIFLFSIFTLLLPPAPLRAADLPSFRGVRREGIKCGNALFTIQGVKNQIETLARKGYLLPHERVPMIEGLTSGANRQVQRIREVEAADKILKTFARSEEKLLMKRERKKVVWVSEEAENGILSSEDLQQAFQFRLVYPLYFVDAYLHQVVELLRQSTFGEVAMGGLSNNLLQTPVHVSARRAHDLMNRPGWIDQEFLPNLLTGFGASRLYEYVVEDPGSARLFRLEGLAVDRLFFYYRYEERHIFGLIK